MVGMREDLFAMAAERRLKNQVEETVFLARSARECGALAASAFGAGFGGSVWAMVRDAEAVNFENRWRERYLKQYPQHATRAVFFKTAVGPGAFEIKGADALGTHG